MDDSRRKQSDRLSMRLSAQLAAALDDAARNDDRTRSEYVREVLCRELRTRTQRSGAAA